MSAFLFGQRAAAHVDGVTPKADPDAVRTLIAETGEPAPQPTGRDKMATILAGLIPADILVLHAILLQFTTEVDEDLPDAAAAAQAPAGGAALEDPLIQVTDEKALKAGFIALCILAVILYAAGRYKAGGRFQPAKDIALALVPALAFVGWAAFTPATAFDGLNLSEGTRGVIGIVCAALAIAASTAFTGKTVKPGEPGGDDGGGGAAGGGAGGGAAVGGGAGGNPPPQ